MKSTQTERIRMQSTRSQSWGRKSKSEIHRKLRMRRMEPVDELGQGRMSLPEMKLQLGAILALVLPEFG